MILWEFLTVCKMKEGNFLNRTLIRQHKIDQTRREFNKMKKDANANGNKLIE